MTIWLYSLYILSSNEISTVAETETIQSTVVETETIQSTVIETETIQKQRWKIELLCLSHI